MNKFIIFILSAFIITLSLNGQTTTVKQQEIAPGIYKLSLGNIDKFTPYSLLSEAPKTQSIAQIPKGRLPFDLNSIMINRTKRGYSVAIPLNNTETLYGFGLQIRSFTQSGRKRPIVSDRGDPLGHSNAPQTFYLSNAGYGIIINTARYTTFYCGTSNLKSSIQGNYVFVDIPSVEGIEVFVISGTNTRDVVERYNLLSGGGCLPPLWGLGVKYLVKSDASEKQVMAMADYFREKNIPCDVLGLDTSWQTSGEPTCSYVWSDKFPNHQQIIKDLKGKGFRISLWERPYIHPSSPIYKSMIPLSGSFLVRDGLIPDFTIAESVNIFTRLHQSLLNEGVAGFKMDESDNSDIGDGHANWGFPDMAVFPSGLDGEQMHQLLGGLYLRTLDGLYKKNNMRSYQTSRSSGMFMSSAPAALYCAPYYTAQEYVQMICNSAFGGLLLSPEVKDSGSETEFFHRLRTVLLSPQAMISAFEISNPPWMQYDKDRNNRQELLPNVEEMENNVRKLINTRMALIPYLYTAFNDYRNKGTPPFRPLIMDYPNDSKCRDLRDQYMIGENIMVAPLYRDENKRKVYFPRGTWYDFNTNKTYRGGNEYEIETEISHLPIYMKAGTILPLAEPVQSVKDDTVFNITCIVYGNKAQDFELFEDDGISYNYEKGISNKIVLSAKDKKGSIARTGNFKGKRYEIINWVFIE